MGESPTSSSRRGSTSASRTRSPTSTGGTSSRCRASEEQWLTESFAEYSAALFLKQFKGNSTYNLLVNHWKTRAAFATDASPIPLANLVSLPNDYVTRFAIRTGLIYDKGAYLLATLHKELGDDDVPDVPQVVPEVLPMEVRLDEDRRGPASVHDEERLRPVLRGELLGNGNAQVRGTARQNAFIMSSTREWRNWQTRGT